MVDGRQLLREAQEAELAGDKARARELLERSARIYEDQGKPERAEQLRRHAERLTEEKEPLSREREREGVRGAFLPTDRGPVLADKAAESWCSFCCRPQREVGPLVHGPTDAFICAQCATEARQLLDGSAHE
jgi:hypothetical protein